jgi:Mrp family chromosome partitioning ATPase
MAEDTLNGGRGPMARPAGVAPGAATAGAAGKDGEEAQDARRATRITTRFPVAIVLDDGSVLAGRTTDISALGLRVEVPPVEGAAAIDAPDPVVLERTRVGARLRLQLNSPFLIPREGLEPRTYRVVWQRVGAQHRVVIGLAGVDGPEAGAEPGELLRPDDYVIPEQLEAEFLRLVEKMNLELAEAPSRAIVLTSSDGGAAASGLAWWLASALARVGRTRVLFVDGNLRPGMPTHQSGGTVGLLEVLQGDASIPDAVIPLGVGAPDLLNAGGVEGFLGSEITDAQIAQILRALRDQYRYIVIDALPVNTSPLALMLLRRADGAFLVVESGSDQRQSVQTAVQRMREAGVKLLGVLLDRAPRFG